MGKPWGNSKEKTLGIFFFEGGGSINILFKKFLLQDFAYVKKR